MHILHHTPRSHPSHALAHAGRARGDPRLRVTVVLPAWRRALAVPRPTLAEATTTAAASAPGNVT